MRENKINYIKHKLKVFSSIYNNKNAEKKLNHLTNSNLDAMSDREIDNLFNEVQFYDLMYHMAR